MAVTAAEVTAILGEFSRRTLEDPRPWLVAHRLEDSVSQAPDVGPGPYLGWKTSTAAEPKSNRKKKKRVLRLEEVREIFKFRHEIQRNQNVLFVSLMLVVDSVTP